MRPSSNNMNEHGTPMTSAPSDRSRILSCSVALLASSRPLHAVTSICGGASGYGGAKTSRIVASTPPAAATRLSPASSPPAGRACIVKTGTEIMPPLPPSAPSTAAAAAAASRGTSVRDCVTSPGYIAFSICGGAARGA